MHCQACDKMMSDHELVIDDSLCSKCRSHVYDLHDHYLPLPKQGEDDEC